MEKNYRKDATIDEVLAILDEHHSVYNRKAVLKAYAFAEEKHANVLRKTGEPYIFHPLRVAKYMAELGFETDIIIGALLHDVVEDASVSLDEIKFNYGAEVATMIDGVTKIDKNLDQFKGLSREEIHALSDQKFLSMLGDLRVLYIKLADRRDNLYTYEGWTPVKRLAKASHTRELLIPLALRVNAEKIANELEDLCFRIEHESDYACIENAFETYKVAHIGGASRTLHVIKNSVSENYDEKRIIEPSSYVKMVHHLRIDKRSFVSVSRMIYSEINTKQDFTRQLQGNIAWYDLTLVLHDRVSDNPDFDNPLEVFFHIYNERLSQRGITLLKTCYTTRRDSRYVLLRDNLGNMFRVFVKTRTEYLHYKLGNIIDSYEGFTDKDEPVSPNAERIKIFRRNGASDWIEQGATVLDFAFAIHPEVGLCFDYAMLNDSKEQFDAYHKLTAGDKVEIVMADHKTAEISWFRYLRTYEARKALCKHFSKEENLNAEIERIQQKGQEPTT